MRQRVQEGTSLDCERVLTVTCAVQTPDLSVGAVLLGQALRASCQT